MRRMRRLVGGAILLALLPGLAAEGSPQVALVIGNGAYAAAALSPAPACPEAARQVADGLRGLGYAVTLLIDAGTGPLDAGIAAFARQLRDTPGGHAVAYACVGVAGFRDQVFLLPVTAQLARASDVMTQGVLARALVRAMAEGKPASGLVALDGKALTAAPADAAPSVQAPSLQALADGAAGAGLGLAATLSRPDGAAPLAAALLPLLHGPELQLATVPAALRERIGGTALAGWGIPDHSGDLAGAPAPPPVAPPPVAPPPVAPPASSPPEPPPSVPPPPAREGPALVMPADADMTEADRRQMQAALARLGYYSGAVDGRFGPNTRAAIRRFQFELKAPMTGVLTAAEATRLAAAR